MKTEHAYIGGSVRPLARLAHHRDLLEQGRCHNPTLQFAWDLFGAKWFRFEVVERCPQKRLSQREKALIEATPKRFNILRDGRRITMTDEIRRKLSKRAKEQHKAGKLGRQTWRSR